MLFGTALDVTVGARDQELARPTAANADIAKSDGLIFVLANEACGKQELCASQFSGVSTQDARTWRRDQ